MNARATIVGGSGPDSLYGGAGSRFDLRRPGHAAHRRRATIDIHPGRRGRGRDDPRRRRGRRHHRLRRRPRQHRRRRRQQSHRTARRLQLRLQWRRLRRDRRRRGLGFAGRRDRRREHAGWRRRERCADGGVFARQLCTQIRARPPAMRRPATRCRRRRRFPRPRLWRCRANAGAQGWWSLVAGPAGLTLGGDESNATSPAIVADSAGPWVAWTQTSDGATGLYVAHDVDGVWTAVGGSATGLGLSLAGASASNPSIALLNGAPIVAWTSTTRRPAAQSKSRNTAGGQWVGLGGSHTAAGISGVGAFDDAEIVATSAGPVVTWRDLRRPRPSCAPRGSTEQIGFRSAGSSTIAGSAGVPSHYALATDGTNIAVAFSTPTSYGAVVTVLQSAGGAFSALPSPITTPALPGRTVSARRRRSPMRRFTVCRLGAAGPHDALVPRIYAAMYYTAAPGRAAGTGAESGCGPRAAVQCLRSAHARRGRRQADLGLGRDGTHAPAKRRT